MRYTHTMQLIYYTTNARIYQSNKEEVGKKGCLHSKVSTTH
uniref:Uncharacterized protein n=1 Tax=Rhizophora mucronata TaxID=61149 RepID=A0A2P2IH05_RHIMU